MLISQVIFFGEWLANIEAVHEVIFVTIESLIVMSALLLARQKSSSLICAVLYALSYFGAFLL